MDPTKVCQICFTPAIGEGKWYFHYGTVCCFRCKAFFRRYSRGEIKAKPCKHDGQCIINKGRKNCKDCRYKKCLAYGMTTALLLNEEERKKYTHPKKNKKKKVVDLESLFGIVQGAFNEAINEFDHESEEIHTLVSGHLANVWLLDHSFALIKIMESTQRFFQVFSMKLPAFQSFLKSDQDALLESNARMYCEYVIGKYMTAGNGVDQLDCILGLYETVGALDMDEIQQVTFDTVNFQKSLVSSSNESYYQRCLESFKSFKIPQFLTPVLCYYILFDRKFNPDVIETTKIEELAEEAKNLLRFSIETSDLEMSIDNLEDLIQVLFSMANLRKERFGLRTIESRHCANHEKQWIESAYNFFCQIQSSMASDWDYVQCYIAFNSGVPHVRHKFLFESQNMTRDRITMYLKRAFGFNVNLPTQSSALALIIGGTKVDNFKTLGEAIKFVSGLNHLGDQETKLMNQPNRHFIQNRAIQKLIDFRVLTEYQRLWTNVGNFVRRNDIYLLVILDLIFDCIDEEWSKAIKNLLFKKITDCCALETTLSATEMYGQFVQDVQSMAALQQQMMFEAMQNPQPDPITMLPPPPPLIPIPK